MKLRSSFVCQQCGYETPQWYGKCPGCGEWNSLVETVSDISKNKNQKSKTGYGNVKPIPPQILSEVKHIEKNRHKSGFGEFDRVVGGGIVPGSVILLAGDPGIGKSTLLLHIISRLGGLYISGEESNEQIKLRAKRLGINGENIIVMAETNLETIDQAIQSTSKSVDLKSDAVSNSASQFKLLNSNLVVIDSIQTISSDELDGMPGSVGQVKYCSEQLVRTAKQFGIPIVIIGHVTKEGSIAGPKVLEHMVDAVLYLEGERYGSARILKTLKNRFGAVEEVGIFEMNQEGLTEIDNPSALFLRDRVKNVSGSAVTVLMEGTRSLLVEIQALTVATQLAIPRRVGNGFDFNRLQMLVAIMQKRLSFPLGAQDIFVNVSGGLKISDPSVDLAVVLSIISSFTNIPVQPQIAAFGEVGLMGEIRSAPYQERRIREAKRLGFSQVLSSDNVRTLKEAVKYISKQAVIPKIQ